MGDDGTQAPGLAGHLKHAIIGAVEHTADAVAARKLEHTTSVLETFERDIAPLLAPAIQQVLDNPATPEHLKALLSEVGAPQHFSSSLLIGVAVGAIIAPVLGAAAEPLVQGIENGAWVKNPSRPASPDVYAAAVLKGVRDPGQGAAGARLSGLDDAQFGIMVEASGQSIGIAEALLLWRRGQIDLAHLREIVQYSNINPKFYDDVEKLQYAPPTVGEVITGALKGHLDPTDARTRVGQAGVDPANFEWLLATAGRPISPLEAVHLWNRGEIDEARVDEVIKQSDINPTFAREVKLLRHYFPPPRSVVPMLRSGSITEDQARRLLTYYGVDAEWVDAFIAEANHHAAGAAKELTRAQVTQVYEARLIDRNAAHTRLIGLGLPDVDANLLLDLADEKRTLALQNAGARAVGSKYVSHRLTKAEASNALGTLQVPTAAQHDMFTVWDVERQVNVHLPSPAAIMHLYRQGDADPASTKRRLSELGISVEDMIYFIGAAYPPSTKGGDEARQAIFEIIGA